MWNVLCWWVNNIQVVEALLRKSDDPRGRMSWDSLRVYLERLFCVPFGPPLEADISLDSKSEFSTGKDELLRMKIFEQLDKDAKYCEAAAWVKTNVCEENKAAVTNGTYIHCAVEDIWVTFSAALFLTLGQVRPDEFVDLAEPKCVSVCSVVRLPVLRLHVNKVSPFFCVRRQFVNKPCVVLRQVSKAAAKGILRVMCFPMGALFAVLLKLFGHPHRGRLKRVGLAPAISRTIGKVANLPHLTSSILRKVVIDIFDSNSIHLVESDVKMGKKLLKAFFDYQCGHTPATADRENG